MLSEDDLIARYFAPIAGPGGLGLLDDAALVSTPSGRDLVVTADALVAEVHFFAFDPAASIARKSLAVNLSDLAAKGAEPLGFVLTLALPPTWTPVWLADFASGLAEEASRFGCPLLGGDTVRTPGPLSISITAFGSVPSGRMVRRTGARPGDHLYVTGTVGDAALGLRMRLAPDDVGPGLGDAHRAALLERYLHPQPRLALRDVLGRHASGGMDVSDGLVGDLRKMMRASGASAAVNLGQVPLSAASEAVLARRPDLLEAAVTGCDDYEVLASVPPAAAAEFELEARRVGVPVTCIGRVGVGEAATLFLDPSGAERTFARESFAHF